MRWLLIALGRILGAIIGAHALAYLLVGVLPNASISALGIFSANRDLLSAFAQSFPTRSYPAALWGLFVGDLGMTLDGRRVASELVHAVSESAPRIWISILLLVGGCVATALAARKRGSSIQEGSDFLAFLPPFVVPFLGLAGILGVESWAGIPFSKAGTESIAILSLSSSGAAVLVGQTLRITRRNLQSDFARSIRAAGATESQTRIRLLHNLVAEVSPAFEKLVVGIGAALFFVEPILGLSGFGTLAARAVRRSDADLLMGVTAVFAIVVATARLAIAAIRSNYGMED